MLGGALVQSKQEFCRRETWECVTDIVPTVSQAEDLEFAAHIVSLVKSNAIVLVKDRTLLAVGSGQTSRVGALDLAIRTASDRGVDLAGCVLASDGFFPFTDNIIEASKYGVKSILQPGGSIMDSEVIEMCKKLNIEAIRSHGRVWKYKGEAFVNQTKMADAIWSATIVDKK